MIIPVVLSFLSTAFAQELGAGDPCILPNGRSGICALLINCPSVSERIKTNSVEKVCGYSGFDAIVCCPRNSPTTTTTTTTKTPLRVKRNSVASRRGAKARQKCAEYSQYVWALQRPRTFTLNPQPVNVSKCAIKSQTLIVGGTRAEPKEFPHMAAVGYNSGTAGIVWVCGGSLISEKFVLTAAHCTSSKDWGQAAWVRVGDSNLKRTDDNARPEDRRIIKRIRHPRYRKISDYHDIALLRLESRVPFNEWIRPACLHTEPTVRTTKAITTGWGHVRWDTNGSDDLLKVTLPFVAQRSCNRTYFSGKRNIALPNGIIEGWMLCAGEPGSDACQGDSGGPLVTYSKQKYCMYDIVGVTNSGKFCGSSFPGVYARVYHYLDWIESVVWP